MKTDTPRHYAIVNERKEIVVAFTTEAQAKREMHNIYYRSGRRLLMTSVNGWHIVKTATPVADGYSMAWIDRKPYIADIAE